MWSAALDADFRSMRRSRMTRAALGACAAIAVAAAVASPAQGGVLTTSATDCTVPELTQPFARWGDYSHYKLVDGGAFETGTAGWELTGGGRAAGGHTAH